MIAVVTLLSLSTALSAVYFSDRFFKRFKVGVYYIDKYEELAEQEALEQMGLMQMDAQNAMDLRGTPTHQCVCGCNIFNVKVIFDNFEVATYFLDMECVHCGSVATAPTPLDRENME